LVRLAEACQRFEKEVSGTDVQRVAPSPERAGVVESEQLSVWVPSADEAPTATGKNVVFKNLKFDLVPGERALLCGPSGVGKSMLLRALAGAWPHATGNVKLPMGKTCALFSTTETYVPPGELRDAVTYPVSSSDIDDEKIEQALKLVGLEKLLTRTEEGLGSVQYWQVVLSAGQKNRLALARMVLHRPKAVLLDEPVAHIDEASRASVLAAALGALPSDAAVLVISHDLSSDIRALFNATYVVDSEGKTLEKSTQWWPPRMC
jgi:ABC-type uncharacterized transport system fused permease/ATPase subunit